MAEDNPYAKLPERVRPEDMIAEQAAEAPGDPTLGGRDPERDWLLRNAS
jgi:hypothetical protein